MKYVTLFILLAGVGIGICIYERPEVSPVLVPYATWCNGEVEYFTPTETECVSLTKDGMRIATTSVTTGLKYFGDTASTSFSDLTDLVDTINDEVEVQSVTILPNGDYRIRATVGDIFVQPEGSDTMIENILLFLRAYKDKKFIYIDARHGSSIFYKINEE